MNLPRCAWCGEDRYVAYHDTEWGFPVRDDTRLFEKLCLEGFQSGLSWLTILRKRPAFRAAFAGFDPARVARFGVRDVRRLLADAGIVRHRGKIESTINRPRRRARRGTAAARYLGFEPPAADRRADAGAARQHGDPKESIALSKDLKRRGWTFVGPTTVYAFMQAMGLVNDHVHGCTIRKEVSAARANFRPPLPR
jgi:DNA-3-methyladenine glycosylase I